MNNYYFPTKVSLFILVIYLFIFGSCNPRYAAITTINIKSETEKAISNLCSRVIEYNVKEGHFPDSSNIIKNHLTRGVYNYMVVKGKHDKPKPFCFIPNSHPYFSNNVIPEGIIYLKCYIEIKDKLNCIGYSLILLGGENPDYDCMNWKEFINNRKNPRIPNSVFTPDGQDDPILFKFDYFINYPADEEDKIFWVWS
jgi:hypothetical protein